MLYSALCRSAGFCEHSNKMALPIDQKEYLKRYMSAEPDDSSKKKRRKKVKTSVKVTR